jgi:molecular chaperone GrpE
MTDSTSGGVPHEEVRTDNGAEHVGPIIRDRRRLDPQTGKVRAAYSATEAAQSASARAGAWATASTAPAAEPPQAAAQASAPGPAAGESGSVPASSAAGSPDANAAQVIALQALVEERVHDLQRLQAEYVNYRRRVERDKDVARDLAVAGMLESLLPVLDDVHLARQHGDLTDGPFAAIADKLEAVLSRYGLVRYGEPGETFDPNVHDALMHMQAELAEGTTDTTVVQVLQPGYRAGERILRAARVAVADPS